MFERVIPVVSAIWVAGCASGQLNFNTLDLASSSDDLMTSQVLSNLSKFRSSPYTIPSQVSITAGSATTTNAITPTATAPLGAAGTTTLLNSLAAPLLNVTTHSHVTGAGSIGVSVADQYSQNWSLSPLEDPDQLRRLRALYRFGVRYGDDSISLESARQTLLCEYPLVQKAQGAGGSSNQQTVTVNMYGKTVESTTTKDDKQVTKYLRDGCDSHIGTPDPEFLKPPGCVICDYRADESGTLAQPLTTSPPDGTSSQTNFTGDLTKGKQFIDNIRITSGTNGLKKGDLITSTKTPACTFKEVTEIMPTMTIKKKPVTITGIFPPGHIFFDEGDKTLESSKHIAITISVAADADNDNKDCNFTANRPPSQPKPKPEVKHHLEVNRLLSNEWAIFGDERPQEGVASVEQEFAKPLGNGRYDIYLNPGHDKEYSDFVLFVLEATLQSTSGGTAKGTSQKAGAPVTATVPAGAQIQVIQ